MTRLKNICQGLREYLFYHSNNPSEGKRYGWERSAKSLFGPFSNGTFETDLEKPPIKNYILFILNTDTNGSRTLKHATLHYPTSLLKKCYNGYFWFKCTIKRCNKGTIKTTLSTTDSINPNRHV